MKRFYFSKKLETSVPESNNSLRAVCFDTSNWGEVYISKALFKDNSNFDFLFGQSNSLDQIEEASRLDILNLDFCRIVLTESNDVTYIYDSLLQEDRIDTYSGLANAHFIFKTTTSQDLRGTYINSGKLPIKLNDSSLLENEHTFVSDELFQIIAKYPGDYADDVSVALRYGNNTNFNIGGNTYKKVIVQMDSGFDLASAEFVTGYYDKFPKILYCIPTSVADIYEVAMLTERNLEQYTILKDDNNKSMIVQEVLTRNFDYSDDSNTLFNNLFSEELDSSKLQIVVFYKDQLAETFQVSLTDFAESNELNIDSDYIRIYLNTEATIPSEFKAYRTYLNYGLNGTELDNDYLPTLNANIIDNFSKYYLFASIKETLTETDLTDVVNFITSGTALKNQVFYCVPDSFSVENPYILKTKDSITISDTKEPACLIDSLLFTYFLNNYIFNIENLRVGNGILSHIFRTSPTELQFNSKGSILMANLNPVTDLGYRFLKFKLKKDLYKILIPLTLDSEEQIRSEVESVLSNYLAYGTASIQSLQKINKNIKIEVKLNIYKGIEIIEVYS